METPISKLKAAVYQKTPAPWLPSKPKVLTALIVIQVSALVLSPDWREYRIAWIIFGASIPIAGWLAMRWRIYSTVFITPKRSKVKITDSRWEDFSFRGWGDEKMKAHFLRSESGSEETILYLHGYNSSLGRGESRCQHMNS
ncbi:MAG: hypothetical protein P8Q32_04270, partial [Candidatus Thalassarchaeaceae archaeon]|nr:hypothetical protein [Candidatus Thalassarchaeaceae archaeon]